MQRHTQNVLGFALALLGASGCDDADGGRGRGAASSGGKTDCTGEFCEDEALPTGPLEDAFCEIEVLGEGSVPTETEYLANVIFCENGEADIESLKAMAIAARSIAYWEMGINGDICDGDHCQVFTCDGEPSAIHHRAVEETAGMYLFWGDEVTYGFYVPGRESVPDSLCEPLETENYVTYNLGQTGESVEQTELGWISDPQDEVYGQNRGCMSKRGMQCLEGELEYGYLDILRYYYGADIEIGHARGACVDAVEPEAESGSGSGSGSESGSESESESGSESESESDGRPPRPGTSESESESESDTASSSTTDTAAETEGDTEAASDTDTEASDTEASDTEASDTEATSDTEADTEDEPWGGESSSGGGWPDDDYEPGGEPSPWGDDSSGDTDTDTDGDGADSERSGCSVSAAGDRQPTAIALGLLLLGMLRRTRARARA